MVKKGSKDFKSGLDMLIPKLTEMEEPEIKSESKEVKEHKTKQEKEKETLITISIPVSLKRNIKKYCAVNDLTLKSLFVNSVKNYMNE